MEWLRQEVVHIRSGRCGGGSREAGVGLLWESRVQWEPKNALRRPPHTDDWRASKLPHFKSGLTLPLADCVAGSIRGPDWIPKMQMAEVERKWINRH